MSKRLIQSDGKPFDGGALVSHLAKLQKSDLKLARRPHSFTKIPLSHLHELSVLGRKRYSAIAVSTIMSSLWDGWTSTKKSKRVPSSKVMMTKRMLHQHFGFGESTAGQVLSDLSQHGITIITQKGVYSGRQGKNLGTLYRLPWMEKSKGKQVHIYWGMLISESFLALSVTLQAVIILLHQLHSRKENRLTIKPNALKEFGVHRNKLPRYVNELRSAGFLYYIEGDDYEFSWFDKDGQPSFNNLKTMHLSHTDLAPNSYQVVVNE